MSFPKHFEMNDVLDKRQIHGVLKYFKVLLHYCPTVHTCRSIT